MSGKIDLQEIATVLRELAREFGREALIKFIIITSIAWILLRHGGGWLDKTICGIDALSFNLYVLIGCGAIGYLVNFLAKRPRRKRSKRRSKRVKKN